MRKRDVGFCGFAIARPWHIGSCPACSLNFSFFHEEGAALGHASVAAATTAASLCQLPPAHERLAKHSGGESDMIM